MRFLVVALCAVGLFVSVAMQGKTLRAARGELTEPSVVGTPRARLIGGTPNSAIGIAYYVLMAVASFFFFIPAVRYAALCVACVAAAMSAYLAYSLLFVTRMPCLNCWTGHVINLLLLVLLLFGHL